MNFWKILAIICYIPEYRISRFEANRVPILNTEIRMIIIAAIFISESSIKRNKKTAINADSLQLIITSKLMKKS